MALTLSGQGLIGFSSSGPSSRLGGLTMRNGLPDQRTLQRRLRAARALQDVTLRALAERLDPSWKLSERTLRKLESGESEVTERALQPIAAALEVPYGWFTTDDPFAPWRGAESPALAAEFERRLRALEARVSEPGNAST
jgi:transcriptional regulator with XRE-family HTH domain